MRLRFEYYWMPFLGGINIQFEFVHGFSGRCYSTDIWLLIIVSGRFQHHISIKMCFLIAMG